MFCQSPGESAQPLPKASRCQAEARHRAHGAVFSRAAISPPSLALTRRDGAICNVDASLALPVSWSSGLCKPAGLCRRSRTRRGNTHPTRSKCTIASAIKGFFKHLLRPAMPPPRLAPCPAQPRPASRLTPSPSGRLALLTDGCPARRRGQGLQGACWPGDGV